ncbi:hypothetical protein [Mesorhizobium sp. 43Arga]
MAKITPIKGNLPSEAIQADLLKWLEQVRSREEGNPDRLLTGLSSSDPERWEIGVVDAWLHKSDPTKIVLKFPKPASHPEGEEPTTDYLFDQETVFLLGALIFHGGRVGIYTSKSGEKGNTGKPNGYYYPAIWIDGFKGPIPVDRLIANAGPAASPSWRTLTTTATIRGQTSSSPPSGTLLPKWAVRKP